MEVRLGKSRFFLILLFLQGLLVLPCRGAVLLAADGQSTVYVADTYFITALTSSGTKWRASQPSGSQLVLSGNLLLTPTRECELHAGGGGYDYCKYYPGLYALDKSTGTLKWSYRSSVENNATIPVQIDALGYIHYDGHIFSAQDGSTLPESLSPYYENADGLDLAPFSGLGAFYAIGQGGIYYETAGNLIRARDHYTGVTNWTSRVIQRSTEPVIAEDGSILVSDLSGSLYALDRFTGAKLWELPGELNRFSSVVALAGNRVAAIRREPIPPPGYSADQLLVLDAKTGAVVSSNIVAGDLKQDSPMLVLPNGTLFASRDQAEPLWFKGSFRYADSTWPKPNSKNSNIRSLAFAGAAQILAQPGTAPLIENAATFSVYAGGTGPFRFQWFKNGSPVPGATNGYYVAPNPGLADLFTVSVANSTDSLLSDAAGPGYTVRAFADGGRVFRDPDLAAYPSGSTVVLSAESYANRNFAGWTGSTNSPTNPLTLKVQTNLELSASFANQPLDLLWRHVAGDTGNLPILPGGSNVIFIPMQRQLLAIDTATRRELWQSESGTSYQPTQAALSPSSDLVLTDGSSTAALESSTGRIKWTAPTQARSMAIDPQGNIYTFGNRIIALSPEGAQLWASEEVNVLSPGFIGSEGVLYTVDGGFWVRARDRLSGKILWSVRGSSVSPAPRHRLVVFTRYPTYDTTWPLSLLDAASGQLLLFRQRVPSGWNDGIEARVTGDSSLVLGPDPNSNDQSWMEWNLRDNSLLYAGRLGLESALVTGPHEVVTINELRTAIIYDVRSRTMLASETTLPSSYQLIPTSLTLLPNGRIAALAGPGFLQIYEAGKHLAESVNPSPNLNLQSTRSLLKDGAPEIQTQPVSQVFAAGSEVRFAVDATGRPPLAYQWYRNGQAVPGATNAEVTLSDPGGSDLAARYFVRITNLAGIVQSEPAVLGYLVKTFVEGLGAIEPDISGAILAPNERLALRAVSANRRFLGWTGSMESTNESLSFIVSSNLAIHAKFEAVPGDLLWEAPLSAEVQIPQQNTSSAQWPLHASEELAELILPGLVKFDLGDRSMKPLLASVQDWTGALARRGEHIYSPGKMGSNNVIFHYQFGNRLQKIPILSVDAPVAVDAGTNVYALVSKAADYNSGPIGALLKLGANGALIWSNNFSPYFYTAGAQVRIANAKYGALWRPTPDYSTGDFILFDPANGNVLLRTPDVRNFYIPLPSSRFTAPLDPNQNTPLGALDLLTQTVVWTNLYSVSLWQVTDDHALICYGGRTNGSGAVFGGIKSIDLKSGRTQGFTESSLSPQSLLAGADHRVYIHGGFALACVNLTNNAIEWTADRSSPTSSFLTGPLCLTGDGILYGLTQNRTLAAYKASAGLAGSSWPEPNGKGNSFAFTPTPPLLPPALQLSADGRTVTIATQWSAWYTLQSATAVTGPWNDAGKIEGTGQPGTFQIDLGGTARFFRIQAAIE